MKKIILISSLLISAFFSNAQNIAINTDGSAAATSAMLDVKSTTKGMLMPRMTSAQRAAIISPVMGLQVYDTDTKTVWAYNGASWTNLSSGGGLSLPYNQGVNIAGNAFRIENSSTAIEGVGSGTSTPSIRGIAHGVGGMGVFGVSPSGSGTGVTGTTGDATGVYGFNSGTGTGVFANSTNNSGLALRVNGNLRIAGGNTTPSNGAVLTSDANGNAVWKNKNIGFTVSGLPNSNYTNVISFPANSTRTVHLPSEEFDYGNSYAVYAGSSPSFGNSVFVAPISGVYHFDAILGILSSDNSSEIFNVKMVIKITRVVNSVGTTIYGASTEFSSGMRSLKRMGEARISKDIRLVSGDLVQLEIINSNSVAYQINGFADTAPHFGCHLVFEN